MSAWLARFLASRNLVPRISSTERAALEAGTVWVEGDLFSGRPDFRRLLSEPYPDLTAEELAFLDGPADEVCARVDEWRVTTERELPEEVWAFLKVNGFFGLTIPKEYGGKGFSALACSAVIGKLATRSGTLSAVVLIPNSVGPGELLLAYGTAAQKDHYLPRLARGDEIPCFALTEPGAGSDAASLASRGTVFAASDGRPMLRMDWNKRYITLAPVATLIGLAVRLEDPEGLLGRGEDVGITCVLVPASSAGVEIGRRHDPMGVAFPNGPTSGRDVVVSADQIIGGPEHAGRGWQMLMEALSAGRSISLPAQSAAGAKALARVVGAYSAVRRQFGMPIGRFEGIEEPLARIGGFAYLMEAARVYTCGAVDAGHKPAVVSAIVKYQQTELVRRVVQDAMDVLGGAALCRGPRNVLANAHASAPIGITVEGANILTRTLIVYGQGALRCHPYARREIAALAAADGAALAKALAGHALFFAGNVARLLLLGLTRGRAARTGVRGALAPHARRLAWASARFAVLSDLALVAYGSRLKQRGRLTGRFADALSWMYLAAATLRRFEAEGRRPADLPVARWALAHAEQQMQTAFEGILGNFEAPLLGPLLRGPGLLWCRGNALGTGPSDRLGAAVAALLRRPDAQRDRLTAGVYVPRDASQAIGRLERAFRLAAESAPILDRIRDASRHRRLGAGPPETLLAEALNAGVITESEAALVHEADAARDDAVQVDSFTLAEYRRFGALADDERSPATASA